MIQTSRLVKDSGWRIVNTQTCTTFIVNCAFLIIFSFTNVLSVLIHLNCIGKNTNILQKLTFCGPWKKQSHTGLEQYEVSKWWNFYIDILDEFVLFISQTWGLVPDRRFRVSFCGWIWMISSGLRFCPPSILRFVTGLFLSMVTVPRGFSMPSGVQPAFSRESLSSQREGLKPC